MTDVPLTLLTTVEDVLALAAELGEHDISPAALRAWTARLRGADRRLRGRPAQEGRRTRRCWRCSPASGPGWRCCRWSRRSRRASAPPGPSTTPTRSPTPRGSPSPHAEVGRRERARWQVVLLDEYQDTSVGQLRMLEALFGGDTGHPVLAVGDPRQSIYGWRGASAGTIERFDRTFPGRAGRRRRAADPGHQLAQRRRRSSPWPTRSRAMLPPPDAPAARPRARADAPAGARSPSGSTRRSPRRPRRWPTGSPPAGTAPTRRCRRRDGRAADGRGAGPRPQAAARHRRRAARARRAGRGRRPRRAARGARGVRRRRHADRARRPDRRRRPRPAAHRRALADRPARPRRTGGARAGAGALAAAGPAGRGGTGAVRGARAERGSIVEALDDLGGPDAYSAAGYRRLRRLGGGARPPARPARRVAARPGRRGRPHAGPGDRAGQRARRRARPAPAPTSTRCTASPPSSPSWPSCRRCRRSSATCATPRSASAAWSRARSRSTRRRSSCSPGTPRRGWSGTSSPCPGMTIDQFPAKTDTSDSWITRPRRRAGRPARSPTARSCPACGCRCPGPATRPSSRQALRGLRPGVEGLRHRPRRSASATSPSPAPGTCCSAPGSWWRDGVTAVRAVVAAARPRGRRARTAPATVVHWAERAGRRRDQPGAGGVAGRASGRPTRCRPDGAARSARPPSWSTPPRRTRSTRSWRSTAATRRRAVGARRRPAAARAGPARRARRSTSRCRRTCRCPRWSRCAATRPSWPGGCAGRCPPHPRRRPAAAPPSTPGWRSGSARPGWSTSTSCPAPATSSPHPTARWPSCRRRSSPASGPTASRPRSRCRSRRRSGPLTLRGRIDAVYADGDGRLRGHRLEDRPAAVRRRARRRRRPAGRLPAGLVAADRRAGRAGQRRLPPRRRGRHPAPGRPARRGRPARPGQRDRGGRGMSGERDLAGCSRGLDPVLADEPTCSRSSRTVSCRPDLRPFATVDEDEGLTVVVPRADADRAGRSPTTTWPRASPCSVHSDPAAVGMTAACQPRPRRCRPAAAT